MMHISSATKDKEDLQREELIVVVWLLKRERKTGTQEVFVVVDDCTDTTHSLHC